MADKRMPIVGMGDTTLATRLIAQRAAGAPRRGKKRKTTKARTKKKASKARTTRRTRSAASGGVRRRGKKRGRLKKGSPEAKRRMAKLRGMKRS